MQLPSDWQPRPYQAPAWNYLEQGGKRACLIWHRRSGKDDLALNWSAVSAFERIGEYWHMLPEAAQGRKVIWEAVNPHTGKRRIDQAFPQELRANTRDNEMMIRFKNGSLWRVVGSDNYNSLVGATPVGVVFSEWALADPNAWAFLRPILVENGGWAIFVTTPRGPNHARKTYDLARKEPGWFSQLLTADETKVFTPKQLEGELREYIHDYGTEEGGALYEQEYKCSFDSPLFGSYYGAALTRAEREGRIGNVSVDRGIPVDTAWDLGGGSNMVWWFCQRVGREIRLVDCEEGGGGGFDEHARILKDRGYLYGTHYFPHDLNAHELMTDQSRKATLRSLKIEPQVVPLHNVNDGINATRRMLERTWIDERKCEKGLNALRNYQREWDDDRKIFKPKPLHNWASHFADAARCYAAGSDDPRVTEVKDRHRRDKSPEKSAWAA